MSYTWIPAALRRSVVERASECCEYCGIPEKAVFAHHQIDHIISEKHGGATESHNLAFCCLLCNKNKGSDIASIDPRSGEIVPLFNPRNDDWATHFELRSDGRILAKTGVGRATARLLRFDEPDRITERHLLIEAGEIQLATLRAPPG